MATIRKELRKKGVVWSARFYDQDGFERKKSFALKWQAEEYIGKMKFGCPALEESATTRTEPILQLPEMTFQEYSARWLAEYAQVFKSEAPLYEDGIMIKKHLLPAFGCRSLSSLGKLDMKALQVKLARDQGLKNKTINNITSLAHKMMDDCVGEFQLLAANPFMGYKRLSAKKPAFAFWEIEERDQFLAKCESNSPSFHDIFYFALNTGCRFGEVEGLKRRDLDFKSSMLSIQRKWNVKTGKLENWLKMNKGPKYIPMNTGLLEILGKYRFTGTDDFIFGPQNRQKVRAELARIAMDAGVPPLKFHELRHTFPSNLASAGVPIVVIQKLMGHESIAMTMRYAHLGPDATRGYTEALVTRSVPGPKSAAAVQGGFCG